MFHVNLACKLLMPTAVGGEGGAGGGEECQAEYLENAAESRRGNSAKRTGSA